MTTRFALMGTGGAASGRRIEVGSELVLGRGEVDVSIPDEEASRRHAVVRPAGDAVEIEDLRSLNGTRVNGRPIGEPTRLSPGDVVELGDSSFVVEHVRTQRPAPGPFVPPQPESQFAAPPEPVTARAVHPRADPAPPVRPTSPQPVSPEPAGLAPRFAAPEARTRRRAATRQASAIVMTYSVVAATAFALLVYFAAR